MTSLFRPLVSAAALAVLLSACGGGGSDTTPRVPVSAVKVMGDSLADVGTFGLKFTVQGADLLVYPERVARSFGINSQCNFFRFTGATFVANPTAGCTNYAIGGGRVNGIGGGFTAGDPRSIDVQFQTASGVGYTAGDLLLVVGGGNDAADLVGAYLGTATGSGSAIAAYQALLLSVLDPATVGAELAKGAAGFASVGTPYMQALADKFYATIKMHALDRGATRIALLNMPGITNTPRFQMVLDGIAAASGGGSAGAAARAQSEALFKGWVEAFNARLASKVAGDTRIALVDFYTEFNHQVASPAQFALSNVKTPACPITGVGSDGLPTYNFATCTASALSAAPPAGASGADWWKAYAFSDGFHPTPYGHQLLAQLISRSLAQAGWI